MAIFIIKGKKSLGTLTRETDRITIGSRSSCTLPLEDPLCAEEHFAISASDGGFALEDLGSSSGTFINGLEAKTKQLLAQGDEIVAGVSKFKVEIDAEKKQLTLNVKEKEFFYDKKADPLNWVRKEVAFGKFPLLRYANWVAILLLLISLPFFFIPVTGEILLEPGKLCPAHQLATMGDHPNAQGCESCHDPRNGTPVEKCEVCHKDLMVNQHPFGQWEKTGCSRCHSEHLGGEAGLITLKKSQQVCKDCHDEKTPQRPVAAIQFQNHGIAYNTFSHEDHISKQNIACNQCHTLNATPQRMKDGVEADFSDVSFSACMKCHATDSKPEIRSKKTFSVTWHGTDQGNDNCLQCHQQIFEKTLKSHSVEPVQLQFAVAHRTHQEEFANHPKGSSDACIDCHRKGTPAMLVKSSTKPFFHETHTRTLQPNANFSASALSQDCAACHSEQKDAKSLAQPSYQGAKGECATCHKGTEASVRVMPEKNATAQPRVRNDFPHQAHLGKNHPDLKDGCFSCHNFGKQPNNHAKPATLEKAANCLSCHASHRDISGGSCYECHKEGDPSYSNKPLERKWPANSGFRHQSPGHAPLTNQGDCLSCHDSSLKTAKTIAEIKIPDESQQSCRDCHIQQKSRFHWR